MVTDTPPLVGLLLPLWDPLPPLALGPRVQGVRGELQDPVGIPGDGSSVLWGHVERRAPEAHTGSHSQTLGGPRELAAVLSRRGPPREALFPWVL